MVTRTDRDTLIPLNIWMRLSGLKSDKLVPFMKFCTNAKITRLSKASWQAMYDQFLSRPVR